MAAFRAMEFGTEIGIGNAIVEGDSEIIVKALRNRDNGFSYSHIRRDSNKLLIV
ncbi:hypothetical protein SO802_027966 [Lithocarpus litseifolius]|uniref:RNase H type-1 domain-containing protein n=1 Tax=Lithocarpus litseifolius TaxID=425828 RepID=A0AAW2BR92_9ROSI